MGVSKYKNDFKLKVINLGIDKKVKRLKRQAFNKSLRIPCYQIGFNNETGEIELKLSPFLELMKKISNDDYLDCGNRLNDSQYKKAKRVKEKVQELVNSGSALFITLTFKTDVLAKTSALTRRRYVQRYLKANCNKYVANVDYGAKNRREHYHAIVDKDINLKDWHKLGAINIRHIHSSPNDLKKVSLYITKLSAHALKEANLFTRLIYSR